MPFFLRKLKADGYLNDVHITIFNVGSRKIVANHDQEVEENWSIFAPNLKIYGFDADADACEKDNAEFQAKKLNWQETYIPQALSNTVGEATLYVTNNPMCSSLYPPNEELLTRFPEISQMMALDFCLDIETTTLDEFCKQEDIIEVDFLQIDVQGAELLVLEGATELLTRSVLALQLEVEFSPLYLNQPLFAEVDSYLRQQNFSLFNLHYAHYHYNKPTVYSQKHYGHLLWGEAFYLRDLIARSNQNPKNLLKLACVADALGFFDYAMSVLKYLTLNYGKEPQFNFAEVIIESLSSVPELAQQGVENYPIAIALDQYRTKKTTG